MKLTITDNVTRQCGDCQLCCKLLPIKPGVLPSGHKPAGARCIHQRHGKGCMIYDSRPSSCAIWNCRWLVNDDTADLPRPDRSHYVLDIMPDFLIARDNTGSMPERTFEVVQVWVDPDYPDAWREPRMLAYLERRGTQGIAGLIRFNERDALAVFPPSMTAGMGWQERAGQMGPQHSSHELREGIAKARSVLT
jgi:hypothetical protein